MPTPEAPGVRGILPYSFTTLTRWRRFCTTLQQRRRRSSSQRATIRQPTISLRHRWAAAVCALLAGNHRRLIPSASRASSFPLSVINWYSFALTPILPSLLNMVPRSSLGTPGQLHASARLTIAPKSRRAQRSPDGATG